MKSKLLSRQDLLPRRFYRVEMRALGLWRMDGNASYGPFAIIEPGNAFYLVEERKPFNFLVIFGDLVGEILPSDGAVFSLVTDEEETA